MRRIQLVILITIIFLMNGCATGYMTSYKYNPTDGQETKTVYSPLFSSESVLLTYGVEFRVSVVITRRTEPISYSLLASVGGLTSDDLESKATAVIHFKNDSKRTYKINLKGISISGNEFKVHIPEIILTPGDRVDSKEVFIKAPTYDTAFFLKLQYDLDGRSLSQKFSMQRQEMGDLKERGKKGEGG